MIRMILTRLLWSRVMIADRSIRMRVLYQPLADLSIGCFEVGTHGARTSDVVPLIDDQAKRWRPWPDDWDNDSWMMNCCLLLIVHFFLLPKLFCWLLHFSVLSSVFECRLFCFQIAPKATLCPRFLIIFSHKDHYYPWRIGKISCLSFQQSSFFQVYNQNFLFIFFFFHAFIFA